MLTLLAAAQSVLAARLIESTGRREPPIPSDWLYRRTTRLPFTVRLGRALRFSEEGLNRWIRIAK